MNALVYEGVQVGERDDQLCLTDMWRAAGNDPRKRPARWAEQDGAREFIGIVADSLNVAVGDIWISDRGQTGSTWAHWQIGLAYAKYLSPEFHMWCNKIVRKHMEQRHSIGLSKQVELKLIESLERRVDHHEERLDQHEHILANTQRLAHEMHGNIIAVKQWTEKVRLPQPRRFSEDDANICYLVLHLEFGGKCPIDRTTRLTDDKGNRLPDVSDLDHWHGPQYNRIENALPVSLATHKRLTSDPDFRSANAPTFQHFHLVREKLKDQGVFARFKRIRKVRLRHGRKTIDCPGQINLFDKNRS